MELEIASKETILRELTNTLKVAEKELDDNIVEIVKYAHQLEPLMVRANKLWVDAQYHLDVAMKSEILETFRETAKQSGVTATAVNKLVNSLCAEERYLANLGDRVSRSAEHRLKLIVTMISKYKEEMKFSGLQPY